MKQSQQNIDIPKGRVLGKALINAQQNLKLSQLDIADIIHSNPSKVSRLKNGGELDPNSPEGMFAVHFLRIYRDLGVILADDDVQSKEWLTHYNDHLQGVPIDMLKSKSFQEMAKVLSYLDAMRGMA